MRMREHPPHASMSIIFIFIYLGEVYQAQRDEVAAALDVLSRQKEELQQIEAFPNILSECFIYI